MQDQLRVRLSEDNTSAVYELCELRNTTAPRLVNEAVGLLIEAHLSTNRAKLRNGEMLPQRKNKP